MKGSRFDEGRLGACLAAVMVVGLLIGCGGEAPPPREEGETPADQPAQAARPQATKGEEAPFFNAAAAGEEGLSWTAPEAWTSEPPANPMRMAQYSVPAAAGDADNGECVVFYFGPGQGGPPRANAERWAGMFRDETGTSPQAEIREDFIGTSKVMYVEVEGTYAPSPMMGGTPQPPKPGYQLLGAVVEGPDANWFFKCTGPEKTMEENRAAFEGMIGSVKHS